MRTVVIFLALCSFMIAAWTMVMIIKQDLAQYMSESECVESKITLGIERSDIATDSGTCWVREESLNKPLN